MSIEEITHIEYALLIGALDDLPFEKAAELHGELTAKYYAYVDKAIQCKKAAMDFKAVGARVRMGTAAEFVATK
ncbi:hypothetical protein [Mucilaginibacter auburnensis]|uniref:Uncharacterized protein n=1 Tax=Mucilaginibacter auburnensis TaxID=1457233 RepID=A0A2H9VR52_9SPHI|nr:hypothetical protein [Mucilaginibacter auburnensis]PJJ83300.1 hypothetical protein CLV57_0280 [Mucilaginibacter auburnensis]